MRNLLQKKLNKKGFTLAELLIVVAIIAILVAIAMPIFFGALDEAKEQTYNANARALKAIGVTQILTDPETYSVGTKTEWYVTGTPDGKGDFTNVSIADNGTETSYTANTTKVTDSITVKVTQTEVTH